MIFLPAVLVLLRKTVILKESLGLPSLKQEDGNIDISETEGKCDSLMEALVESKAVNVGMKLEEEDFDSVELEEGKSDVLLLLLAEGVAFTEPVILTLREIETLSL